MFIQCDKRILIGNQCFLKAI
jgi:methionyl-tRNA synthetase